MISAFGIYHGDDIAKTRKDLVPAEGRPSKYTPRIEDTRAAARNKFNAGAKTKASAKGFLKVVRDK